MVHATVTIPSHRGDIEDDLAHVAGESFSGWLDDAFDNPSTTLLVFGFETPAGRDGFLSHVRSEYPECPASGA